MFFLIQILGINIKNFFNIIGRGAFSILHTKFHVKRNEEDKYYNHNTTSDQYINVKLKEPKTIKRSEGKARRVVDKRKGEVI